MRKWINRGDGKQGWNANSNNKCYTGDKARKKRKLHEKSKKISENNARMRSVKEADKNAGAERKVVRSNANRER